MADEALAAATLQRAGADIVDRLSRDAAAIDSGREVDAVCAKHRLKYTERTGVAHEVKRGLSRRARREARRLLERGQQP